MRESTFGIKALLFDLGGVVVEIDFGRALDRWHAMSRLEPEELRQAFQFDAAYRRHEIGAIQAAEYFAHLRHTLQLEDDHAKIAEGWNAIYIGEIAETLAMVRAARAVLPCYAFTNTNAVHQAASRAMYPAMVQAFDKIFASHEIGHRKPDAEAFDHVARAIGVGKHEIMFFDDLAENVEGAGAAGLQAVHVRSPADVRAALRGLGIPL